MGRYRARDLLLLPTLVSALRLPLAVAFPLVVERPRAALLVLVAGGLSDVLDGWLARRRGQATPTGAVVDGILDKLFAFTVVATLVASEHLSLEAAPLLALREIGELPLVVWWALHRDRRRARARSPRANRVGKLATVLQFATVVAVLERSPLRAPLLWVTAAVGVIAAWSYWRRELSTR